MRGRDGARLIEGWLSMAVEIERKFLVQGEAWKQGSGQYLNQGYLSRDPARTVRVRIAGESALADHQGRQCWRHPGRV